MHHGESRFGIGTSEATPVDLGFRMPPEWAPHAATWISWPHNVETWPGKFETVEPVMEEAVRTLAESETVRINAPTQDAMRSLERRFAGVDRVELHVIPTNDAWIRDHGATFVTQPGSVMAIDWRYNAWGGKYPPWNLDDNVARAMADVLGIPCFRSPLHCEGGAIEVDGDGLLMSTESCLLNKNRNPAWTKSEVEQHLASMLDLDDILWLPGSELEGDDTDGHIDNLARFVGDNTVLVASCVDDGDVNVTPTNVNLDFLRGWRSSEGNGLTIRELALPRAMYHDGRRLPASYANFYIANELILLPTYAQPNRDDAAAGMIGEHFPGRRVVGIDCTDLIWGLGAFHCLTQQVPA